MARVVNSIGIDSTAYNNNEADNVDDDNAIQSIFSSTSCYDLLASSTKGVVFETSIPFQLAFFALVEHDTEIAPVWDPEKKAFVALMCISDYIHALQICRVQGISMLDLASRSIADMLSSSAMTFQHPDFNAIDAEDSVHQLCLSLHRLNADYAPVIDPDNGHLVGILGYLDLVHLLDQAAKQHAPLFARTIEQLQIGKFTQIKTIPLTVLLSDVITELENNKDIIAIPIVDDNGTVVGLYHKLEISFIIKATDPDSVMTSLNGLRVGEALAMQEQQSGDTVTAVLHPLVTCNLHDSLAIVLDSMMRGRSTVVVCIDNKGKCLGIISIKDIVTHFLESR